MVDVMVRNIRFAFRGLRRAPGFAAAVILILSLGIGANAVMFGVIDRLLLSPPQYVQDADAVRHIYVERRGFDRSVNTSRTLAYPDFTDLTTVPGFSSVAAYTSMSERTMGTGADAERVRVISASASLFPLLGVVPVAGRFFNEEEDQVGAALTAVLSHEFWERRFGTDADLAALTVEIAGIRAQVVGVAPRGFTGAELTPVDLWLPIVPAQEAATGGTGWIDHRNWWWLRAAVRIEDGTTTEVAEDMATAAHRGGRAELIEQDRYDENARVIAAPIIAARGPNPSDEARVARWLAGVSAIVLMIACFNVANLLLARAARWRRELAVRMALGVTRGRLLGQLLTESLVLAGLGALGALLVARWGGSLVHTVLLPNVAFIDDGITGRLAAFLTVATVMTALLAGFLPALQATKGEVAHELRAGGRSITTGASRTRTVLLVAQAALSVVLLIGAGLFVTSLRAAETTDLGFDATNVAVVRLDFADKLDLDAQHQIHEDVRVRLARLPGVSNAALSYTIPFWSSIGIGRPRIPGVDSLPPHPAGGPYVNKVSPEYFATMSIDVLRGRGIEASDQSERAPPVAVLTESMADAIWPDGPALGQCLLFGDEDEEPPCTTVVGVTENFRRQELREDDPHLQYFVNWSHPAAKGPAGALMVRTVGPIAEALDDIRREAAATSSSIRFPIVQPLMDNIEPQMRSWKLGASMFSIFGVLALVVAGLGLYSVLAFDIALRRTELGIRSALGAESSRLVGTVLRRSLGLVTLGLGIGVLAALAAGRFVQPLLYGVSPRDPSVFAAVTATLFVVALAAGSVPAWRVTRVDPREALQAE